MTDKWAKHRYWRSLWNSQIGHRHCRSRHLSSRLDHEGNAKISFCRLFVVRFLTDIVPDSCYYVRYYCRLLVGDIRAYRRRLERSLREKL